MTRHTGDHHVRRRMSSIGTMPAWFRRKARSVVAGLVAAPLAAAPALAFDPAAAGYKEVLSQSFATIPSNMETTWWYQQTDACEKAFIPGSQIPGPNGLTLHIQSLESIPACNGTMHDYSYAHLDAFGTAYANAYWEASVKSSGQAGTLTAWWLLPQSGAWPPEVDITEIRGDYPTIDYMTNHYGSTNASKQFVYNSPAPLSAGYHTYGVLLDGKNVTWYLDGVQEGQSPVRSGDTAPMFPVLSLYTGDCYDGWAGCPQVSGTTPLKNWSATASVQWVHVWQK